MQLQISSAKPYCELAVQHPFFEISQSCVSTTATLSHRFKSSPAIPGKVAVPGAAGYLMNAGRFSENHVSSGDLNRSPESRGSQTSGVLLVLFVQAKRIKPFPFGKFEVLRTSNQRTKLQFHTSPIKSFAALVSPHMVALLTSVRNSPCFGGLRRTKTCHRQLFARPSSFCPAAAPLDRRAAWRRETPP